MPSGLGTPAPASTCPQGFPDSEMQTHAGGGAAARSRPSGPAGAGGLVPQATGPRPSWGAACGPATASASRWSGPAHGLAPRGEPLCRPFTCGPDVCARAGPVVDGGGCAGLPHTAPRAPGPCGPRRRPRTPRPEVPALQTPAGGAALQRALWVPRPQGEFPAGEEGGAGRGGGLVRGREG